jgi:uncharacterized protein (DUF1800 family)
VDSPANGGAGDLDRVIEIVCAHPSTARHIAGKLCRRFIADEPPETAVSAVATAFQTSRGDIRETLRTLFRTETFWASAGGKFKRPFHFVVSALRATNAETDGGKTVIDYLDRMGHAPFRYPTPDGYPEEESHWLGTMLWRWKFAIALEGGGIPKTQIDREGLMAAAGASARNWLGHLFHREPLLQELEAAEASGNVLSLSIASPGFQRF